MPALVPTELIATITWLGFVPDRTASLRSVPVDRLTATFVGIDREAHSGVTRPSCSRVVSQHPRGTTIRNVRQLSVLSAEELATIAMRMGVKAVDPSWLGAQMVVCGIPDFSHVPPSSRLQTADGTTLTVDMQNRPCHLPARVIDEDVPGAGARFKRAAHGLRGVMAWVEREGDLRVGEALRLHVPDQRAWAGAGSPADAGSPTAAQPA